MINAIQATIPFVRKLRTHIFSAISASAWERSLNLMPVSSFIAYSSGIDNFL